MGWNSFDEGISATRRWGNSKRKKLDQLLGVEKRVDENHPEVIARKAMTREEEAEYLAKRYWISKDKPPEDNARKE
jgi:HEPN domain-containing protein